MGINPATYVPQGDKRNSAFFEEYRAKIYERRLSLGLDQVLGSMRGLIIHLDTGDGLAYLGELALMTPYRLQASYISATHRIFVLCSQPQFPRMLVMEPLSPSYEDDIKQLNMVYPLAQRKPNARYVGEILQTSDLKSTQELLESCNIRFHYPGETQNSFYTLPSWRFTVPSDFTHNRLGYSARDLNDPDSLELGQPFQLTGAQQARLEERAALSEQLGISKLIEGIDHMATRVLAGEREDAILEYLTLSNYYFWGAYNIEEMNSSTNVTRHPEVDDDKKSPAKVFTANNTPSFVNSFENKPMPTEDFVRNYGRRMHHIAYEVSDGDHNQDMKNVDFVVEQLRDNGVPFLAQVIGECTDQPDLKQIFSKHSPLSVLITEYVERCHGFSGFFTRENVASLTEAAGHDERYDHGHVFD